MIRFRVNTKYLLFYILLVVICTPTNAKHPLILTYLIKSGTLLAFAVSALLFFKLKYYRRKELIPVFLWFAWLIIATVINGTSITGLMNKMILPLASSVVLSVYLFDNDLENAVTVIAWILTAIVMIQMFSFVTHMYGTAVHNGRIVNIYFMGIRVNINKIMPFVFFFGMLNYKFGKKRSPLCLLISTVCCVTFVVAEKVSTSMMGYAIIVLVFILSAIIKSKHLWRNLAILVLILGALFVFLYSGDSNLSRWLFVDTIGEDITLSGRTVLWQQAISYMKGIHWIIGNGFGHNYVFRLNVFEASVTHNQYLETIFVYGIIGFVLYAWMCIKQLGIIKNSSNREANKIFFAVFLAILIMQIPATVFEMPYYYLFYIASLYLPQIVNINSEKTKPRLRLLMKAR